MRACVRVCVCVCVCVCMRRGEGESDKFRYFRNLLYKHDTPTFGSSARDMLSVYVVIYSFAHNE